MVGRESAGAPEAVHAAADVAAGNSNARALRSLNVAVSAAMVLGEAMRQLGQRPKKGLRRMETTDALARSMRARTAARAGSKTCRARSWQRSSRSKADCPGPFHPEAGGPGKAIRRRGSEPITTERRAAAARWPSSRAASSKKPACMSRPFMERLRRNSPNRYPAPRTIRASGRPAFRSSSIPGTRMCRRCT